MSGKSLLKNTSMNGMQLVGMEIFSGHPIPEPDGGNTSISAALGCSLLQLDLRGNRLSGPVPMGLEDLNQVRD